MKSIGVGLLLVLGVVAFFFRPFFQPIVMHFVIHPLHVIFFGIVVLGGLFSLRTLFTAGNLARGANLSRKIVPVITLLLFPVILMVTLEEEFRFLYTAKTMTFAKRESLPVFTPIRLMPKNVAKRYADDSFQSPQEYLGDSQIAIIDGKLQRIFPRLPEGFILELVNKLTGFVLVDVGTTDRTVSIADQTFEYAENIIVFDNVYYQLPLRKYFVTYSPEPVYLKDDQGKWVSVVSYIAYKGFPFRIPYWGGVMVIHADGTIEDLSPEEAGKVPYLMGNRLYPKELSVYYSTAYSYRNGIVNKWFLHKEEIEIVSLPQEEPVLHVPSLEGFKQMVVAEPYGRSYGIYKIFFFDATTGKREIIEYDQQSLLTGPIAASDYIRKEFPTFDWTAFRLAEPRPLTVGGDLYWLLSVIPNDSAGIAATVLLNTKTNRVIRTDTKEQLLSFLSSGEVPTASAAGEPSTGGIIEKIETIQRELEELKKLVE